MRVLFTNWHYSMLGGAQTWVYTAARALAEMGHTALVWSDGLGILAERTAPFARCSTDLADLGSWDVVWGSHQITGRVPPGKPRCQIIHATQNQDQEAPVPGLEAYFAVSEEVRQFIVRQGFACAGVVLQPIDTQRFRSRQLTRPWPPRVLYFGNYQRWVPLAAEACKRLGVPFAVCGGPKDDQGRRWDVENALQDADLVLGQTRCVLEAMACERNAIVCSGWDPDLGYGLDGFVTPATYAEFVTSNLTGNIRKRMPTVEGLIEELRKYDPSLGPALRALVVAHHEPPAVLRPLLEWSRSVVGTTGAAVRSSPMRRVGIDLRLVYHTQAGFHRYARGIVDSIRRFPQPDLRFVLLRHVDDRSAVADDSIEEAPLATPVFSADEGESLRREVERLDLDVIHFPFSLYPGRIAPRVVLTMHDLTCVRMPACIEARYLPFYMRALHQAAEADRVITPSDRVAGELADAGLPTHKVRSCYPLTPFEGGAFYEPGVADGGLVETLSASPFLLSAGSIEPRKNHEATLAVFAALRRRLTGRIRLVLVGRHSWLAEPFRRALESHPYREDVCLVGDANDATLRQLLRRCAVFLSSSSYEGFGLPALEALAEGACVLSTPTPSLAEAGFPQTATLRFGDTEAAAERIAALLADGRARTALAQASRAAVAAFYRSCDATRLVQVYRW